MCRGTVRTTDQGGGSGDNDYGQCCATNWGGKDVKIFGASNIFCGTGKNKIINLCKALAKSLPHINPLKIRTSNAHNFPLGVPEGYKFTDYFGNNRPYLRCWDTGKTCGTDELYDDPDLLSNDGALVAIIGAGREAESCTLGGGYGASSTRTSVAFPGLYDSNWLSQIESTLAAFGTITKSVQGMTGYTDGTPLDKVKDALGSVSDILGATIDILEMEDRQDQAEPITSWSELKQYQMRATRDFGLNCIAKNEQVFKQGTSEDMVLGLAGGQYQRIVPDNTDNGALSYTRYHTIAWPKGWRGYITDPAISRRFPNFGADYGGFDINGKLTDLAGQLNAEFLGDMDTGAKAKGLYESGGINNASRGDILLYDQDVVMPNYTNIDTKGYSYPITTEAKWRLPFVAYVTETNLTSSTSGGIDPLSQLATTITPALKKQWVSVIAYNHGKFPDTCGNTDAWGDGQAFKMFHPGTDGVASMDDLPEERQKALAEFSADPSRYTLSCNDPRNSQCVEENWDKVKRYKPREDQKPLSLAGGLAAATDINPSEKLKKDKDTAEQNQNDTAAGD